MSIREPAVAGMFYEATQSWLTRELEAAFKGKGGPRSLPKAVKKGDGKIVGLVSPHAGFLYSGNTAACAYNRLAQDGIPDAVVIIGPNHRQYFPSVALTGDSEWRTPLGNVEIDMEATRFIADEFPQAEVNSLAHRMEHSIEVQLPFLQYIAYSVNASYKVVPVLIGSIASVSVDADADMADKLGKVIASAVTGKRAVVIASTDFTHYKSADIAEIHDSKAIDKILNMDEKGLLEVVASLKISMCGAFPTAIMIAAAKSLGAESAKSICYSNSGDVTGNYTEVVGYAAIELNRL
ncbi:MAG: AmmeMemoRadiSam system protein B [Armatimonadota bacterium]